MDGFNRAIGPLKRFVGEMQIAIIDKPNKTMKHFLSRTGKTIFSLFHGVVSLQFPLGIHDTWLILGR
jgi:hypothetical protein